jgi:hypothetical protein
MGDDPPIRIARSEVEFFRNRLTRNPNTCRCIVDRKRNTPHAGRWLTGIAPGAHVGEVDRRPGLNIPVQDMARHFVELIKGQKGRLRIISRQFN